MKAILIGTLAAILAAGAQSNEAERQLKAATNAELVNGDLKMAIKQYGEIAAKYKNDRAVAAMALVRMAEAYQKMGDAESQRIYRRVLSEYADQKDLAKVARDRLDSRAGTQSSKGDRVVWTGREMFSDGRVSPDGRFISYTDWYETGNLVVYDSLTKQHRPLTPAKDWTTGNAYTSVFSKNGNQLAYGWRGYEPRINELRIIDVNGSGAPRRVFANANVNQVHPTDWSSDGKSLAVWVLNKDGSNQIGIVDIQSGSYRGLKSVDWRGPQKIFFSPDGRYLAYDLPAGDNVAQRDVFVMAVDGSREARVVEHSAQDAVMGWAPDGNNLLFVSDRMGAMGLWSLPVKDGKSAGVPVLLKPRIGLAASLGLTGDGTLYVLRDASTTSLRLLPLDLSAGKMSGPAVVENYVLPTRPDWTPDGKFIAYTSPRQNTLGDHSIVIRSAADGKIRELRPALRYFNELRWMPDGQSLLAYATDLQGKNGIFRIDARTGGTTFLAQSEATRVQISPDGKKIYHNIGIWGGNAGPKKIVERDLASGETRDIYVFAGGKGPRSFELSPDGKHLAGVVNSTADKSSTVMLIPVDGGKTVEVARSSGTSKFVEFGHLTWTPDSSAVLAVKEAGSRKELWMLPVSGQAPRMIEVGPDGFVLPSGPGIRLHPNGTHLAFAAGDSKREVLAFENLVPAVSEKK